MNKDLPEQKVVSHIELPKFMGKWYVIANIPTMFEKGAYNATEFYNWNTKENRIDVDFRFNKDSFDGPEKSIPQKAFVYDHESNAEWRIQPIWPLKFAYLIIDVAADYSDTVIGVPGRDHVWIMARTPQIESARYQSIIAKISSLGYDLSKLQKVPQSVPQSAQALTH